MEVYSPSSGEAMLVATYTVHAVLECLCILTLGCCIFFRYMLTNALPTLKARVCDMPPPPRLPSCDSSA